MGEQFHDPAGCHWGGHPHLGACVDRGRQAGVALTEVRALRRRAETALAKLTVHPPLERVRLPKTPGVGGMIPSGEPPADPGRPPFHDPDITQMRDALRQIVALLGPWQRTGPTERWVLPDQPAQLVPGEPPPWYTDEVGDEMFMGGQAVLAELRAHLVAAFGWNTSIQRNILYVVDQFVRDLVDRQRDDDDT